MITGTTRKRVPSLRSRIDRQPEMHARLDAQRRALFVATERIRDEREFVRGAHQRERDDVRERNLLGARGGFERAHQFATAGVEHVDEQRAETRRGRNRQALLHVAGQRGGRTLQRRNDCVRRNGRQRRTARDGGCSRGPALRRGGLGGDVAAQNHSVRSGSAHEREIDVEFACHALRVRRCNDAGLRAFRGFCRRCGNGGFCGRCRSRGSGRTGGIDVDVDEFRTDGHRIARLHVNGDDRTGCGSRNFDVDLVGRHVQQRIAFVDEVADFLLQFDDRTFGHRLAHLGQGYFNDLWFAWRRGSVRRRRGGCGTVALDFRRVDFGEQRADGNRIARARMDLRDRAGGGRRNFDVDFVGRHVDQGVALGDVVADLPAPFDDGAFRDRLSHLGKGHVNHRVRHCYLKTPSLKGCDLVFYLPPPAGPTT